MYFYLSIYNIYYIFDFDFTLLFVVFSSQHLNERKSSYKSYRFQTLYEGLRDLLNDKSISLDDRRQIASEMRSLMQINTSIEEEQKALLTKEEKLAA